MFCPNCGKSLPDDANFCLQCGKPLRAGLAAAGEAQWETCTIEVRTTKDGKRSGFSAVLRDKVPARERWYGWTLGISSIVPGLPAEYQRLPHKQQKAMADALNSLVQELVEEGWESVAATGLSWWNRDFRRRADSPRPYEKAWISFRAVKPAGFMSAAQGQFYAYVCYGPRRGQEIGQSRLVKSTERAILVISHQDIPLHDAAAEPALAALCAELSQAGWIESATDFDWWERTFRRPCG